MAIEGLSDGEPKQVTSITPRLTARYDRDSWRQKAACGEIDPDIFFPVGTTGVALIEIDRAKQICTGCPVRKACLAFALATNQQFGIWGGCDEDERRDLRRHRRRTSASPLS